MLFVGITYLEHQGYVISSFPIYRSWSVIFDYDFWQSRCNLIATYAQFTSEYISKRRAETFWMYNLSPEALAKVSTCGRNALDVSSKEALVRTIESSLWKVDRSESTHYFLNFLDFKPYGVVTDHLGAGTWKVVGAHTIEIELVSFDEPEIISFELSPDGTKMVGKNRQGFNVVGELGCGDYGKRPLTK